MGPQRSKHDPDRVADDQRHWPVIDELAFAKIKEAVRRVGARPKEAWLDALATALETITATEARAFFRHCGYRLRPDWDQLLSTSL